MKVVSLRLKSVIITALVIIAVAGAILFTASRVTETVSSNQRLLPIYNVETDENKISVSFNCAVGDSDIDKILAILEAYNVTGTFFMLGSWAEQYPECVSKIYDAGHEIGNHSYSHSDMPSLSHEKIILDIQKCNETIRNITGASPKLFRAPSGSYDNKTISGAEELGMQTIQWNVDSLDWKNISAEEIYDRVTSKLIKGSIIQFHTGTDHTAEALPDILQFIKNKNFSAVTIGELIYKNSFHIDSNGKQIYDYNSKTEDKSTKY